MASERLGVSPRRIGGFSSGPADGNRGDTALGDQFIDRLGLVGAAVTAGVPFSQVGMIGVGRISDSVEEVLEPWRPAAVFRRAALRTVDIMRIFGTGMAGFNSFDDDAVLPIIAHVVGITELADAAIDQGLDRDVPGCGQPGVGPILLGRP